MVRIDLKADNVALWSNTLSDVGADTNLLLACEQHWGTEFHPFDLGCRRRHPSRCDRRQQSRSKLLQSLGASSAQTALIAQQCPGLGKAVTWALWLDRHGWLSASPVPRSGELTWLMPAQS